MFDRLPRRDFLWQVGGGLGGIALAQLLGREGLLAGTDGSISRAARALPSSMAGCTIALGYGGSFSSL